MELLHLWSIDLSREPAPQRRAAADDALGRILATHLPEGAAIELVSGEHGKPRLASGGLEFNLSHSGDLALVAVSAEHAVGVDIEKVEADRDPVALAERALCDEDVLAVREAAPAERDLVFHQRWARHEARLKCLGVGIFRESLVETASLAVRDLEVPSGYVAALAVNAPRLPPLRRWTFDPGSASKRREPG
ncbi:MAG TPA: 4'-phosphopantetheinyl transferase superfamily protein [Solirubrobacterales bacterium]|nr:4'-phosphopantetheinyl transferase superfamily protein [Solirubrobacterales bacterium]